MNDVITSFVHAMREPAQELVDPSRRLYWPFLVCSAVLALLVLLARGAGVNRAARALASPKLWLHRSARGDYKLIAARAVLKVALLGSFGLSMIAVAGLTAGWLRMNAGVSPLRASPWLVGATFTLLAFIVEDWARYFVHRLMHRVPLLWEFHKVHHSAEVLTPFTLYRTHPVESLINGASSAVSIGLVTGACAWAFGPALHAWQLLGVDAIGFVWTLLGANLRHSHVWISYGPRVERFLMSPAQHQVHHSADPRHTDKNFGTALGVWDWLAGSLYVTREPEAIRFGLGAAEREAGHGLYSLLVAPFVAALTRTTAGIARAFAAPKLRGVGVAVLACLALSQAVCTPPRTLDRAVLLQSFGRCTIDHHTRFQTAADALVTATEAHAATPGDATLASAARTAWEGAIDAWQINELLRFGPAAGFDVVGGAGLREQIYSWPDVNRCLIEQQLVSRAYEGAGLAGLSTSARGLAAIEYLLFYTGSANGCDAANPINAMGTWAAIAPEELARRRADYARLAAADVAVRARALIAAWEPNGFLAQLSTAGQGSTLFATQQAAFSAVADAAFYLDTDVKDLRLAAPLGILNCTTGACPAAPEALESRYADRGRRHLQNNLRGLRVLLEGCEAGNGLGFDDLLDSAGASALTARMRADLLAAEAAVDAIPDAGLSQTLASDPAPLRRAHEAIRALTNFLKMEFTLTLQIQRRGPADTD